MIRSDRSMYSHFVFSWGGKGANWSLYSCIPPHVAASHTSSLFIPSYPLSPLPLSPTSTNATDFSFFPGKSNKLFPLPADKLTMASRQLLQAARKREKNIFSNFREKERFVYSYVNRPQTKSELKE